MTLSNRFNLDKGKQQDSPLSGQTSAEILVELTRAHVRDSLLCDENLNRDYF